MREAVTFPKPEEVNIIATRNGELTNIPGTEFRTPLAPYKTKLWCGTGSHDHLNSSNLRLYTSYDVTCIPLAIVRGSSPSSESLTYYRTLAMPVNPFLEEARRASYGDDPYTDSPNIVQFGAKLTIGEVAPAKGDRIGFIVQLIGNKTTQVIDMFNSPDDPSEVILPPCYSERVLFWAKNPITRSSFWQPYSYP